MSFLTKKHAGRFRKWAVFVLLLGILLGVPGCRTFSFYRQAIAGQFELWANAEKIEKILRDPQASEELKRRLRLVMEMRGFAEERLSLPVNGHYRKYVDVHRPFVVWNVKAAPEFSMEARTWWYPFVGSLSYRGYFAEKGAKDYADYMKRKGCDVFVGGVTAYSTLGWFKDPVLNTFLFSTEAELAETLFHELAHQQLFAHGDTDFDEAFATTVGEEGARRWLRAKGESAAIDTYERALRRNNEFVRIVMNARARLEALYGDKRSEEGRVKASRKPQEVPESEKAEMREQKQRILDELRRDYAALKASWNGSSEYDLWFDREINNAKLNSVAAYYDLVPGFERLLADCRGDLKRFYAEARKLSKTSRKERHQWLKNLASAQGSETPPNDRIVLFPPPHQVGAQSAPAAPAIPGDSPIHPSRVF